MSVYIFPRAVRRAEIIRPGCPLTAWYKKQTEKPDILFNASLYHGNGKPIGTLIEGGVMTYNAGNGFGVGIRGGKLGFGTPWQGWTDYLSAYYGVVQNGKAMDVPFRDPYVFGKALNRIAFGELADGTTAILTANGVKIERLREMGINAGFRSLCNLDGGGSRALLWLGNWVHTSSRTPYNAVAVWLEDDASTEEEEEAMEVKCIKKTQTYTALGIPESGRYIDKGDACTLYAAITGNLMLRITYPVPGGKRTAYIKDLGNFTRG